MRPVHLEALSFFSEGTEASFDEVASEVIWALSGFLVLRAQLSYLSGQWTRWVEPFNKVEICTFTPMFIWQEELQEPARLPATGSPHGLPYVRWALSSEQSQPSA